MSTRYQRDRELRRALLANKRHENDEADYLIGAVGIVVCIVVLALSMLGWI